MTKEPLDPRRRDFLARGLKAAAAIAVTGAVGHSFGWRAGGGRREDAGEWSVPDFSKPGLEPRLGIVTGPDRVSNLRRAMEALGGWNSFVGPGDAVLLKVNAAFASPPSLGATTHPDLVAEAVAQCRRAGAARVVVTDHPINEPESCFEWTGIGAAARAAGAEVWIPRERDFAPVTLRGGRLIRRWPFLRAPFEGIHRLIGLAPVKDHFRSGASMTLKNWYGLLGGKRSVFHQDIHALIAELAQLVRPTLVILDGATTMVRNGPTGGSLSDLKPTQTMIAGTDPVAADAFGATLLGRQAADLPHLVRAAAAGAGTASYELLNPIRIQAGPS
ncbi:MAG: DUF362 domain-containing protein [Kiritimatiellae bacterium]|nr:DUF362 domain-containing protein [Kiritimatiellia bacterium]